jgi:DNA helicase-4
MGKLAQHERDHAELVDQRLAAFRERLDRDFLSADPAHLAALARDVSLGRLLDTLAKYVADWVRVARLQSKPPQIDLEQAAAIGSVHENVLVTARAGSGKTRTLVTRAAFLIKHCRVPANRLLLLAFNRRAAEEMRERLRRSGCEVPHVMTFHALAYALVHPEEALRYDSADDEQPALSGVFQEVLDELRDEERFECAVRRLMLGHFRADWERLTKAGLMLSQEAGLAFRRGLSCETLDGTFVKSYGEKVIANFLFEHDIPYNYERNHWWNGRNYRPDFTITKGNPGIVIEYFGLEGDGDYDVEAKEKRQYWKDKADWCFIELGPSDIASGQQRLEDILRHRLNECGILCQRLPEDEIWKRIRDRAITRFAKMTRTFVGRCRKASLTPDTLRERTARHQAISEIESTFLGMASEAYTAYLDRLKAVGDEDFDGLLERAATLLEHGHTIFDRKSGSGDLARIAFIMVDEFQDFSRLFWRMLNGVRKHNPDVNLFCVGDDWQAINAFAGSDLRYFEQFDQLFPPTVLKPVAANYRSAASIVEFGNQLMLKRGKPARPGTEHQGQILLADLLQFEPTAIEKEQYAETAITPAIRRILARSLQDERRVALLARTNDIPHLLGKLAGRPTLETCQRVWTRGLTDDQKSRIQIMTTHQAKGLEADTVVILDAMQRRYPLIHPDWVFMRVHGESIEKLVEDERRLFYVACTRAIRTLILITEDGRESEFLTAVKHMCQPIDWQQFPFQSGRESRWVVKVGSQAKRGAGPTIAVKDDLKAGGFRYFGRGSWKHWARVFPPTHDGVQSLVHVLQESAWGRKGEGLEVRLCDQDEQLLEIFAVNGGRWTRGNPHGGERSVGRGPR